MVVNLNNNGFSIHIDTVSMYSFLCILRSFLSVNQVQNGKISRGLLRFQIFLGGMSDIPDMFLGVNSRCRVQAYIARKNESTPL